MPNHIQSQVEIKGSKEKITKLVEDLKLVRDSDVDQNEFDFNAIVKMPPELLYTTSPTQVVATEEEAKEKNETDALNWAKNNNATSGKREERYISKAELERRQKEYNAVNWYDWSTINWGTKWNAYDVKYLEGTDETIVVEISTAWCSPQAIWDALKEQGFTVRGVYFGEMEGYEWINNGHEVFDAYVEVETEYTGGAQ